MRQFEVAMIVETDDAMNDAVLGTYLQQIFPPWMTMVECLVTEVETEEEDA